MLDEAILRPGRFDRLIEVPKPDVEGRRRILEIHASELNLGDDVDFDALAETLEAYSGADIAALTTEAGMFAIRDGREEVRMADFEDAHEKIEEASEGAPTTGPVAFQ
jgi:proteasome regulatory subunit